MKIKICGITNIDDALLCEREGADALGFIFYNKSKRYIAPEDAGAISKRLSAFTAKVGVFVNESAEEVEKIASTAGLDLIQLHGEETKEFAARLTRPIIKSFRVDDKFSFSMINEFSDHHILLDSFSHEEYGGTGKKFQWENIPAGLRNKIILAGGIGTTDLKEIFSGINPAAIDVSSSLEERPGKKDEQKVKSFFNEFNRLRFKW